MTPEEMNRLMEEIRRRLDRMEQRDAEYAARPQEDQSGAVEMSNAAIKKLEELLEHEKKKRKEFDDRTGSPPD